MNTGMTMSAALADYLDRRLKEEGWSHREAAERCGLSKTAITNLINKPDRLPDLTTLQGLVRGFGQTLAFWLDKAGFPVGPTPTSTLTPEEEAAFNRLPPARRRALIDLARQMLDDPDGQKN